MSVTSNRSTEVTKDAEVILYDDTIRIENCPTSFNLLESDDRPDLRNIKYKSTTDHLNCPICQQPFMNPLTTICGHTFCKECIYECFKMSKNARNGNSNENETAGFCPLDRTPLDSANINDLFPTPLIVANLIDDLKVYCLNHERGCEWTGSRWELEHHVLVECPRTGVRCNGKRIDGSICDLIVERRFFNQLDEDEDEGEGDQQKVNEDEENECIHKIFECKFCNQKLSQISYHNHLEKECLFNYKTCELCGNDMIPFKNLVKHQENCIKIGHFKCPANEIGCKWIGSNETSLEIHLENNNCQLYQFLPAFKNLNDKVTSLSLENEFLQKQINKILDSIIQGKITNLGYNDSIEEINKVQSMDDQGKLIYLNFELDRLKYEINERLIPFMNKSRVNEQESVINNLINDNFMLREDLNVQRIMINSLRKQLQYLLFARNRNGASSGFTNGMIGPHMFTNNNNNNTNSMNEENPDMFDFATSSNSDERLNLKL